MNPKRGQRLAIGGFALGNFIFVMRKNVVHTAGVNVETGAEIFLAHGRAFDMPAGASAPPGRIPSHVSILFIPRLPKSEISDIFLIVFIGVDAYAAPHARAVQTGQLSIAGPAINAEINGSVFGLICVAALHQAGNQFNHFRNMIRGRRIILSRFDIQSAQVLKKSLFERRGEIRQGNAGFARTVDGFVIHIRQVHHLRDAPTLELKPTAQQIFKDIGPEVANVGDVVHGWPAGVHADMARFQRGDLLDRARQGVVNAKAHSDSFFFFVRRRGAFSATGTGSAAPPGL